MARPVDAWSIDKDHLCIFQGQDAHLPFARGLGRGETAAIFCFSRAFTRVDLPTLGRPITATKPVL